MIPFFTVPYWCAENEFENINNCKSDIYPNSGIIKAKSKRVLVSNIIIFSFIGMLTAMRTTLKK